MYFLVKGDFWCSIDGTEFVVHNGYEEIKCFHSLYTFYMNACRCIYDIYSPLFTIHNAYHYYYIFIEICIGNFTLITIGGRCNEQFFLSLLFLIEFLKWTNFLSICSRQCSVIDILAQFGVQNPNGNGNRSMKWLLLTKIGW